MDWEQTAAIRIDGEISSFKELKRGVRQRCVLFADPFSLCSQIIIRNLEGCPGIIVGGHNGNNWRCADDTALTADKKEDLQ